MPFLWTALGHRIAENQKIGKNKEDNNGGEEGGELRNLIKWMQVLLAGLLWAAPEHIRDPLMAPSKEGDIYR